MSQIKNKTCAKCGETYPATPKYFHQCKNNPDGLKYKCKKCRSLDVKEYRKKNQEKIKHKDRIRKLKEKYGLTIDEYNERLWLQKGVCFICGEAETLISHKSNRRQRLTVDHNHKTGEIRKLLCDRCNKVLGLIKENIFILVNMSNYLKGDYNK